MHRTFANSRWIVLTLLFVTSTLVLHAHANAVTVPQSFQSENLDSPLLWANMCGNGDVRNTHFTFAATGDTFPHETIQAVAESQGYDYLFEQVRPFLQAADSAYTNFDGAMLADSPYTGYPNFNYNPLLATALKQAGIDVVSTANNHILDRGPEGLDATLNVLQQAGIMHHGTVPTGQSDQARPTYLPITLTSNGISITVGFLSFSWGTNGIPDPYNQVNLLWESTDYGQQGPIRQRVLDAIAQARRETDLVIVAAHWGYEYQFYPDPIQTEGAIQMARAGADVILGAQSHTLQPVDVIDINGRTTLVMYSLANFIADQTPFQDSYYSNTSVIFYVGLLRQADGRVRVSGYRYLPTLMVENGIRPAPIPAEGFESLIDHVRLKMRDPHGRLQVNPDPAVLGGGVEVCPTIIFPDAPGQPISGDFAQHISTLGSGTTPRSLDEARAIFGAPLGPVVQEPAGDCQSTTSVLYTERQRLEWHPEAPWPDRVVGTQIGTAVYQHTYHISDVQRRLNLDGEAIMQDQFKTFFENNGGLTVFGYPISEALPETDAATGEQKTVQYFERARFELVSDPTGTPRVQLGRLSLEYPGIASQCPASAVPLGGGPGAMQSPDTRTAPASGGVPWCVWPLLILTGLLIAGAVLYYVQQAQRRRRYLERRRVRGRIPEQETVQRTRQYPQLTRSGSLDWQQLRIYLMRSLRYGRTAARELYYTLHHLYQKLYPQVVSRLRDWNAQGQQLYQTWQKPSARRRKPEARGDPQVQQPSSPADEEEALLRKLLDMEGPTNDQ